MRGHCSGFFEMHVPTRRYPAFLLGSGQSVMPTSITTQEGFSQLPRTKSGFPTAETTMSASRTMAGRSEVFEWQMVTVAFRLISISAVGSPTVLERPITTALFPSIWVVLSMRVRMARGVPGAPLQCLVPSQCFRCSQEKIRPRPS